MAEIYSKTSYEPLTFRDSSKALETPKEPKSSDFDWSTRVSQVFWSTPKKSTELKAQATKFQELQEQDGFTQRLLFQKIIKGFEEQESVLVSHELRI